MLRSNINEKILRMLSFPSVKIKYIWENAEVVKFSKCEVSSIYKQMWLPSFDLIMWIRNECTAHFSPLTPEPFDLTLIICEIEDSLDVINISEKIGFFFL